MTSVIDGMVIALRSNQALAYTTSYGRILCKPCSKHARTGETVSPMDNRSLTPETVCARCHEVIKRPE